MKLSRIMIVFLAVFMGAGMALAEGDGMSPQQRLMAKRAAELDAYRKMAERILGLQIDSRSRVRDFVGESDDIATAMDHYIKGIRFTDVRYFDDGSVEVDAEVTISQVVTQIKRIYDEKYEGGKWKKDHFDQITKKTVTKVLSVTGSGAARPQSVIADPADQPIVGPEVGTRRVLRTKLPAIYSDYPPKERLKAKRAAELDAYRKMLERIKGLKIDSSTRVGDFVTESDEIRTATEGYLKGIRTNNVRYAPDGVVEVEMSVTIQQVITTVKRVHEEKYEGGRWKKEQFDKVSKQTVRKVITVVGVGALDTEGSSSGTRGGSTPGRIIDEKPVGEEVIVIE